MPDIDRLWFKRLLTREGEKPLGERFRAARSTHRVDCRPQQPGTVERGPVQVALKRFEIADDDGEEVVEVVRDAARDLANSLHLLRLPRALVGRAPLGQIARDLRKTQKLALGALDRVDDGAGPEGCPVLSDAPTFGLVLPGRCGDLERLVW